MMTAATTPVPPVPAPVAGIDIGKHWLDVHVDPADLDRRFENTKLGRRALRNWLRRHGVRRVALEPTGRYHRALHQCLHDDGVTVALANPQQARNFARSLGQRAKNDRVDATMLAHYARLESVKGTAPKPASLQTLADWLATRRKLVAQQAALRKHVAEIGPEADRVLASLLEGFAASIQQVDAEMQACIAADPGLQRRCEIIQSVPGCGPLNAASLCADLPELGRASRREAAALLGVAPYDCDSGQHRGRRRIAGGRRHPRDLLYMAATSAVRCNPAYGSYYQQLRNKPGQPKEHKVALVAVMRKLLTLVNALLRDDRLWQPQPPATEAVA